MSELYEQLLTYWRGLAVRERVVLVAGAIITTLSLMYALLWVPLQRDLRRLRVDVPRERQELQWMRTQSDRIQQLRATTSASIPASGLLSFVEQSAQTHDIRQHIKRIDPESSNAVRLSIDDVAFNRLASWLDNLQKQGGIRIENASLEPSATAGAVNARVLLRVSG